MSIDAVKLAALSEPPASHSPMAASDPHLTVDAGALRVTATIRKAGRPVVRVFVDGAAVHLDTFDLSAARARDKCSEAVPVAHRAALAGALVQLAERVAAIPAAAEADTAHVIIAPVEPWPEPVVPGDVLALVVDRIQRHVHLPQHAAPVVGAWVLLTYLLDVLPVAPILWVYSPTRGCGKSVLLDLVTLIGARTLKSENATLAALFRIAEKYRATLVLDEIDQWLIGDRHGEVSGLLNASFTRGGKFLRTVGDDHEPRPFDVFSFRAVAGIGATLHDTTRSRAYRVSMERSPAGSLPVPLQTMYAESWAAPLRQQLARAAQQLHDALASRLADPDATPFPAHLDGRARDLWLPTLALGAELGEPWCSHLTDACNALSRAAAEDVADIGELLLADCRRFYAEHDQRPAQPAELLTWLLEQEAAPWSEYRHGRALSARGLATLLGRFKIKSVAGRIGAVKARWLHPDQFADAWTAYLPENKKAEASNKASQPSQPSQASQASQNPAQSLGTLGTQETLGTDGTLSQTLREIKKPSLEHVTLLTGETFDTNAGDPSLTEMAHLIARIEPCAA